MEGEKTMTRNRTVLLLFVFGSALVVTAAEAIPLTELVDGNTSIQQGDKAFSNFLLFQFNAGGDSSPLIASGIDVQGITVSGEHGLRFSGPFSATATEGMVSGVGFSVRFDVSVSDPNFLLHDLRHLYSATVAGTDAIAQVATEVFTPLDQGGLPLGVINNAVHEGDNPNVDLSIDFTSDSSAILVDQFFGMQTSSGAFLPFPSGSAAVPFFDVIFSQVPAPVPEPATFVLLATGLAGLGALRCRRQRPR
jgi:PEP-CTERM motif